jgi:hypothetical protein
MMNRRRRSRMIRPPTDHILPAWLSATDERPHILTWRDLWQSVVVMLGGSGITFGALWLGHTVIRFFFS